MAELFSELDALEGPQKRGVLSLLGLCVGDSVGLPFELFLHRSNRQRADTLAEAGAGELQRFALELVVERLGRFGPCNPYSRTYSDDTTCADLKMASVAMFTQLQGRGGFEHETHSELLFKCFLAQLLAWSDGAAGGMLFQGYGGFTKTMLRRDRMDAGARPWTTALRAGDPPLPAAEWPTQEFQRHVEVHCAGKGRSPQSYGNGVVMSYAPQALADELLPKTPGGLDADDLQCLASSHRHVDAVAGADLLDAVLRAVVRGEVTSSDGLRAWILGSKAWRDLSAVSDKFPYCPLQLFDKFLSAGDCPESEARAFLASLTGMPRAAQALDAEPRGAFAGSGQGPFMGRLLRSAANWDDEHVKSASDRIKDPRGGEIRFSQRGLNSVLIALWCCAGARSTWDWLARLLYVGGDTDTVGAVCGQVAGPLLPAEDVVAAFSRFAALEDCVDPRPAALVAGAAARRYFRRCLLFCTGRCPELARCPRLVDPEYGALARAVASADASVAFVAGTGSERQGVSVLWVDRAFDRTVRHGRVEEERRRVVEAEAPRLNLCIEHAQGKEEACARLRDAVDACSGYDLLVTELAMGGEKEAGLELLQQLNSLFQNDMEARPTFCLMTSSSDAYQRAKRAVRSSPKTIMVRHDRPLDIMRAASGARCRAAVVPESLEPFAMPGCLADPAEAQLYQTNV